MRLDFSITVCDFAPPLSLSVSSPPFIFLRVFPLLSHFRTSGALSSPRILPYLPLYWCHYFHRTRSRSCNHPLIVPFVIFVVISKILYRHLIYRHRQLPSSSFSVIVSHRHSQSPLFTVEESSLYFSSSRNLLLCFSNEVLIDNRGKTIDRFVCHVGTYQYNRIQFGFKNDPEKFQRALDFILAKYK